MLLMIYINKPDSSPHILQKIKTSTSSRAFSTYIQPTNHVYQTKFSKYNFKQPDAFSHMLNFR